MQKDGRGNLKIPSPIVPFTMAFENLPNQAQAELQSPAAAVEAELVQERRRGDEDVAGIQGIGVGDLVERAIVARQAYAEAPMIKGVVGLKAELQGSALGQFVRLEHGHVPDVQT